MEIMADAKEFDAVKAFVCCCGQKCREISGYGDASIRKGKWLKEVALPQSFPLASAPAAEAAGESCREL